MALSTLGGVSAVNTITSNLPGRHADPYGGRPLPTDEEVLAALRVVGVGVVRASHAKLAAGWSAQQLAVATRLGTAASPQSPGLDRRDSNDERDPLALP